MKIRFILSVTLTILLLACTSAIGTPPITPRTRGPAQITAPVLFDDFTYSTKEAMERNRWIIRTEPGFPGVPGAIWSRDSVTLLDDPAMKGNRLVRMTSSTAGSGTTRQSQFCHERKYREGTYAARVRFTNAPATGVDGDQIVQTFYMISPLKAPMDLDYSELDFEYLPNGGWGYKGPTMFATTWETFSPEPAWKADNESVNQSVSMEGWHTLMLQVSGDRGRYYVDGKLLADHGGRFYPEVWMSINFNLWFVRSGLIPGSELRTWVEDIDWVFHRAGTVLSPSEVEAAVSALRSRRVKFTDTVPAPVPALLSPCNF